MSWGGWFLHLGIIKIGMVLHLSQISFLFLIFVLFDIYCRFYIQCIYAFIPTNINLVLNVKNLNAQSIIQAFDRRRHSNSMDGMKELLKEWFFISKDIFEALSQWNNINNNNLFIKKYDARKKVCQMIQNYWESKFYLFYFPY